MSKKQSTAYLIKRKAEKIIELEQDHLSFYAIEKEIMKRENFGQSKLILGPMEDVNRAAAFWKVILNAAEGFINKEKPL